MNDQSIAILNGAVAQLVALETSTQAQIEADTSDAKDAQAKLDKDNADIASSTAGLGIQKNIADALTALIAQYSTPVPA